MLRAQTRKWLVRVAYKYWLIKGFKKTKNSHCNLTKKIGISYSSGHKKIGSGPIFFRNMSKTTVLLWAVQELSTRHRAPCGE